MLFHLNSKSDLTQSRLNIAPSQTATNELVAICEDAVFVLECVGEADYELRWNINKKLIRQKLRAYKPSPDTHTQ
ncbi:MAG: hypothetical protein ACKPE3_02650, partial [Sphaerospermopsis kisseleviana]